jgi:hypothetical protein
MGRTGDLRPGARTDPHRSEGETGHGYKDGQKDQSLYVSRRRIVTGIERIRRGPLTAAEVDLLRAPF